MSAIERSAVFMVQMNSRFLGSRNGFAAVLEPDRLVPVLQQEVQLAEHLGDVAAVELVDDEDVGGLRVILGQLRDAPQRPLRERETGCPASFRVGRKPSTKSS